MTKIDKARREIDAIFAKRDDELAAAEHDEAIARDNLRQHTMERDAAAGTNPEKYMEMEKALDADNFNLKMATARHDKIKAAPLFSEDQYKKIRSVLFDTLDDLNTDTKRKLEKLTFEMESDGETLREEWTAADDILKRVYAEMAKDGKRRQWSADTYSDAIRTCAWSRKALEFYNCNRDTFHVE